tara:strand:- start:187 stop:444 length:258 start_codon:yes stop_codon:yes gene_type:complete
VGSLNINKIKIIIVGGITRKINAKNLKVNMKYLFCEIKKRNGGRLIAIPDAIILKNNVSTIDFKKSLGKLKKFKNIFLLNNKFER